MAIEREPPKPLRKSAESTVFNVPKPHKFRPEHHRSGLPAQALQKPEKESHNGLIDPPTPSKLAELRETIVIQDDDSVVEILKPTNPVPWPSYVAPPTSYSSLPHVNDFGFETSKQKSGYSSTEAAFFSNRFTDYGAVDYVDTEKATENIKKLLEGVFEDEEDRKPRTRRRKAALEKDSEALFESLGRLKLLGDGEQNTETVRNEHEFEENEDDDNDDDGSVEGLKVKLLPHQVEGVDWMRSKEMGQRKKNGVLPKGGILADDVRK